MKQRQDMSVQND